MSVRLGSGVAVSTTHERDNGGESWWSAGGARRESPITALSKQTNQELLVLTIEARHQRSLAFHWTVWRQNIAEFMACAIGALAFTFGSRWEGLRMR